LNGVIKIAHISKRPLEYSMLEIDIENGKEKRGAKEGRREKEWKGRGSENEGGEEKREGRGVPVGEDCHQYHP
jgi:hypothetical protein